MALESSWQHDCNSSLEHAAKNLYEQIFSCKEKERTVAENISEPDPYSHRKAASIANVITIPETCLTPKTSLQETSMEPPATIHGAHAPAATSKHETTMSTGILDHPLKITPAQEPATNKCQPRGPICEPILSPARREGSEKDGRQQSADPRQINTASSDHSLNTPRNLTDTDGTTIAINQKQNATGAYKPDQVASDGHGPLICPRPTNNLDPVQHSDNSTGRNVNSQPPTDPARHEHKLPGVASPANNNKLADRCPA